MKNLFIMHTQYNLILSAAVMSRWEDAENTLVLYSEFALSEQMRLALSRIFQRVLVVRESYCTVVGVLADIRQLRADLKKVHSLRHEHFDQLFMSQERTFDMVLCAWAKKVNPAVRCYNIEEDAYYSLNEKYNADNYVHKLTGRQKFDKALYALLLAGYPYDYLDSPYCYGMSSAYHGAWLLFPWLARRELQGRELLEIGRSELIAGIRAIYSDQKTPLPRGDKYTVFFFDLMNRYRDPETVKHLVAEVVKASREANRTLIFKYHPRETEKFSDMADCFEVPHIVPAEKLLYDLADTDTVVIGNATTACIVAAKLGFQVISISRLEKPDNIKMHTSMEKMGIHCIEDTNNIKLG